MQPGNYQETYLTCPYDKSHRLLANRLSNHITKCARNHPDSDLVVCAFNSTHYIPKSEKKRHMENCPDRIQLDSFITQNENIRPKISVDISNDPVFEQEENWGEMNTPAYDPEENCKNKAILLRFDVGSKTQHRLARQEQLERFNRLEMEQHEKGEALSIRKPSAQLVEQPRLPPPPKAPLVKEAPPETLTKYYQDLTKSSVASRSTTSSTTAHRPAGESPNNEGWSTVRGRGRGRNIKP